MAALIKANRSELSRQFPVLGFTVHTGISPSWIEVVVTTEKELLFDPAAKVRRNYANFHSSRAFGPLPAERGEAVYLVAPDVVARFVGQPKVYYALATYRQPDFRNPEVVRLAPDALPYVQISNSFTGNVRSLTSMPNRAGGLTGSGSGYINGNKAALEWGGDMAIAGAIHSVAPSANGAKSNGDKASGNKRPETAAPPVAAQASLAYSYDDGFDAKLWSRIQEGGASDEATTPEDDTLHGIEGPIPDATAYSQAQRYSQTLAVEYPQANRFEPAATTNYRASTAPRTINRIVIHITDSGANINSPIQWFKNPAAKVSAHYIVGQDGEIVQMVAHNDVAWHAGRANGDSIGIEHVANTYGLNPTEAEYCSSAALIRWLADQYNLPLDRTHILGHAEADPTTRHTNCPNAVWNWDYFMGMVTSGTCYPLTEVTTQAQSRPSMSLGAPPRVNGAAPFSNGHTKDNYAKNGAKHSHALPNERQPTYLPPQPLSVATRAPTYARPFSLSAVDNAGIDRMRAEFVANAQAGSPRSCIVITNAGLRRFYGADLQDSDGSDKRLGSTIQDTMAALQNYGLAQSETVFHFNDAAGHLTRGVNRPESLQNSVEQWLLNEAAQNATSAWYLFGLSLMDGYHSVLLALAFSGVNDPNTRIYWADQIYNGWDDVTANLDRRITSRIQDWWDPLPVNRKARTRVTIWPLLPGSTNRTSAISQGRGFTYGQDNSAQDLPAPDD